MDHSPASGCASENWANMRNTIYDTAMGVLGKKQCINIDWFEANSSILTPAVKERRKAHLKYKNSPNQQTLSTYKNARSQVQRLARQGANKYWLKLCQNIQQAADSGNIRARPVWER